MKASPNSAKQWEDKKPSGRLALNHNHFAINDKLVFANTFDNGTNSKSLRGDSFAITGSPIIKSSTPNGMAIDANNGYLSALFSRPSSKVALLFAFQDVSPANSSGLLSAAESPVSTSPWIYLEPSSGNLIFYLDYNYRITLTGYLDGTRKCILLQYNGSDWQVFSNGTLVGSYTGGLGTTWPTDHIYLSSGYNTVGRAKWESIFAWNDAFSADEARDLSKFPYQLVRQGGRSLYFFINSSGAVSGSGAVTDANDVVSGTGTVIVSGSGAVTEASDSTAGTGTVTISGLGAVTEASDTASGTGSVASDISGSGAITEIADISAGTGTVDISGSGAIIENSDIAATLVVSSEIGTGDAPGGGNSVRRGIYWQDQPERILRKSPLNRLMDKAVKTYLDDIKANANPEIQKAALEIVEPFFDESIPDAIDFSVLQENQKAVEEITALYRQFLKQRDEEDVLILLMSI